MSVISTAQITILLVMTMCSLVCKYHSFASKVTSVNVVGSCKQSALKTVTGNNGMELVRCQSNPTEMVIRKMATYSATANWQEDS
jgi:hypothetical protein